MNETLKWGLIILAIVIVIACVGYVLFKKSKYNYMLKMMKKVKDAQKHQEALEKKEAEFEKTRLEKSLHEAEKIIAGLGGIDNIKQVEQCAIRLRVNLYDESKANQKALKAAGVSGILKTSKNVQLIVGDRASQIYDVINEGLK